MQVAGGRAQKRERQRVMRELVNRQPVTNQTEFVGLLAQRGFAVTQATVSRDIGELGLVKTVRAGRHVYAFPEDITSAPRATDEALRRVLRDLPVTVGRSGLIVLLVSSPGSAGAIAEAIDRSSLNEQEGTLAGDNTVLVLFRDEARLERWLDRLAELNGAPLTPTRP
ncbi:MAG TPA: arginine repressor [Candidatus Limnocylindria bacterium]|nr:arginine repressor [Candidatus Limnocylindria bacterium]